MLPGHGKGKPKTYEDAFAHLGLDRVKKWKPSHTGNIAGKEAEN